MLIFLLLLVVGCTTDVQIIDTQDTVEKPDKYIADFSRLVKISNHKDEMDINSFTSLFFDGSISLAMRVSQDEYIYNGMKFDCNDFPEWKRQECEDYNSGANELELQEYRNQNIFKGVTIKELFENPSASLCQDDYCREYVAVMTGDYELCGDENLSMDDYESVIRCKMAVAFYINDPSPCEKYAKDKKAAVTCLEIFNIDGSQDNRIKELEEEDNAELKAKADKCITGDYEKEKDCYGALTFELKDERVCGNMPEDVNERQANKAFCYGFLASWTGDDGICRRQENAYYKNTCQILFDKYFMDLNQEFDDYRNKYEEMNE